jgi:hypothetical protein
MTAVSVSLKTGSLVRDSSNANATRLLEMMALVESVESDITRIEIDGITSTF